MLKYAKWIKENLKGDGYGQCEEVSKALAKAFPELSLRKGIFHSVSWGERQHWWCRTPEGNIVDPTGHQFPDGCVFPTVDTQWEDLTDLSEEDLLKRVPVGVCANCGGPRYAADGGTVCSSTCHDAYVAYIMGEINGY